VHLPLVLDKIDVALIKALLDDGRRSYRKLAKIANVSTPTAKARIERMFNTGFIKKIGPVFDPAKMNQGVSAIVYLRVDSSQIKEFSAYLSSLDHVSSVFLTTGEWNMIIRVVSSSNEELQSMIDTKICNEKGVTLVNSQVVTRTIRDEQGFVFSTDMRIDLTCDYCRGPIGANPFKLKVGEGERFLCCKTCLNSYKEKYGSRIATLTRSTP